MKKKKQSVFTVILLVVMCVYVLSLFVMIFWALVNSLKSPLDFAVDPLGFPATSVKEWFDNYRVVFENFNVQRGMILYSFGDILGNTLIISVCCALAATITPCIMAYLVAKFDCKFSRVIYGIVIVAMILPIVGSLPSELQMMRALHLYDTGLGIILMKANFLGMYFLMFYASFKGIPDDYVEAGKVDGANQFVIFFRLILPFVIPTMFVIFTLQFINFWNDYMISLVYVPSMPTLSYAMYYFSISTETLLSFVPPQLAGSMIVCLPIVVVFLCLKKYMIGNLTVGGIKG